MKLTNTIIVVLFTVIGILNAQEELPKAHPFSKAFIISAEGGVTLGDTDFKDYVMDYFGRGSLEYFFPSHSFGAFGLKIFGGGGYLAGKNLSNSPQELLKYPAYAGINEFRTNMIYGGGGLVYAISLGKVVHPYLFGGGSYIMFNPLDENGNKMPRNAVSDYKKNDISYMGEVGIRFLLSDHLSFNVGYSLNMTQTDDLDDVWRGKKDAFSSVFGGFSLFLKSSSDGDDDGVEDSKDVCPDTPEGVNVDEFGCPRDEDNDGVPDYKDLCPISPGNAVVDENGCPVDTDEDGIADYLDQCANTPANVSVDDRGCPIDSDGDGIADYMDKCPNTKMGIEVDNNGCEKIIIAKPMEVKEEFTKLTVGGSANFELGKSELLPNPKSGLDKLAEFMKQNPQINWVIEGHTDNRGSASVNTKLSLQRANAVFNYFVNQGIDAERFKVIGSGSKYPIADNSTDFGRALNRRVDVEQESRYKERMSLTKTTKDADYNISNEYNIESLIFTDSHYFCIQVSSWKNKASAEKEVNRLKAEGHNAFVVSQQPTHKSDSWYRVRIGYFENIEGAREYIKTIR